MDYALSVEQFQHGKMFDSKGKFTHKTGYRFKLFPFITQPNSEPVLELNSLMGSLLCRIEGKKPETIDVNTLVDRLKEETDIEVGQEDLFKETVRQLFFDSDGKMRQLCIQMLEQIPCDRSSDRVVEYLVDVLGNKNVLRCTLQEANKKSAAASNVFERAVLSKLIMLPMSSEEAIPYFRVTEALKNVFEEDFTYILENPKRSREYLVDLFEFYFFTYTAQTSLQLNCFMDGNRNENIPLYFCLEWEKTSQSRKCFTMGWRQLQEAIEKIFAHAVTLEILNHTEAGTEQFDYIKFQQLVNTNSDLDIIVARKIDEITRCYRSSINDCPEMNELQKKDSPLGATAASIKFLFDSVRMQFENSVRSRAYTSYASKFEQYCQKYLKSRGRSGLMLNLSEETLIFLTKLCIKNKEQMRLKDVFTAFETRGIYLDNISKEQVATYYEKLNLIEKKSDSGDAKYVKRIL